MTDPIIQVILELRGFRFNPGLLVQNPFPGYDYYGKGMSGMADVFHKMKLLKMFRLNPDKFLPVVDHAWKVFPDKDMGKEWYDDPEYNLGWDTGLLDGNRPYFMECWATNGITMRTYFISARGIENAAAEELVKKLTDEGLFRFLDPGRQDASVMKFEDDHENVFFSINITVGIEDELYVEGGQMYPYAPLNEYNSKKKKEDGHE